MITENSVNAYFNAFVNQTECQQTKAMLGVTYQVTTRDNTVTLQRYFVDDHLQASLSRVTATATHDFIYKPGSDLIVIGFCLSGEKRLTYDAEHLISQGDVVYFRPTDDFTVHSTGHECLYYYLDCRALQSSLQAQDTQGLFCDLHLDHICEQGAVHVRRAPELLLAHAEEMKALSEAKLTNFLDHARVKSQLFHYLTRLIGLRLDEQAVCNQGKCPRYYVAEAKKLMLDYLDTPLAVSDIAARLGISAYKLQNHFKQVKQSTVHEFMIQTRIETGKVHLQTSQLPIMEIAHRLGYDNPSKFSTVFKKITGYTPTEYRNLS